MASVAGCVIAGILCAMTTETVAPAWVPSDESFAARLAMVRHRMGWNVKEAAHECGFPAQTWRIWEMDGSIPRNQITVAKQIAGVTGCDYLWLLMGPEGAELPTRQYFSHDRVVAAAGRAQVPAPRGPVRRTRPMTRGAARPVTPVAI